MVSLLWLLSHQVFKSQSTVEGLSIYRKLVVRAVSLIIFTHFSDVEYMVGYLLKFKFLDIAAMGPCSIAKLTYLAR